MHPDDPVWGSAQCHTAVAGEECFKGVNWAMKTGIHQQPKWYPGLSPHSSFTKFQALLHQERHHDCPEPCPSNNEEFVVADHGDAESEKREACPTVEDDFDYPGGNLKVLEGVSSLDACCQHCGKDKECRQWTHDRSTSTCTLKHQDKVGRAPKQGVVSGLAGHDSTSFQIKSAGGDCLEADDAEQVSTRPCKQGGELQLWVYNRGTGEIYGKHGNCIHALDGEQVRVKICSGSQAQMQKWEFDSSSGLLRNPHSDHCLTGESGDVKLAACSSGDQKQQWSMEQANPKDKGVKLKPKGKPLMRTENGLFEVIEKGTCEEAGMTPIVTKVTCEYAAVLLRMVDTKVRPTNILERPEGCYMFEMDMLWMGINPKSAGRGWQKYRTPICMRKAPLFTDAMYVEQDEAAIAPGGEVKIYGVGSSNMVWMSWIDQMHLYLQRLGYKQPLVEPKAILSRITPRSVPICDDTAYYAKSTTGRLGMVGWNSWDFAYNDWDDCDKKEFRNISGHRVKCGVGPGCKGGEFLISAASIAEDAAKSNVTIVSTWYNDHKAFLTHYDCFDGEKLMYEKTAEVTVPSIIRTIREIHKKNPYVVVLVMGLYPPTLDYKVVEAEVPWIRRLNQKVKVATEKEPNTYFVDYDLPGGDLEMYDRVHYGHPNCRGAKVMVYAALQKLYDAKLLKRGIKSVNPKVNIANPNCHLLTDEATCGTSALCWVDPADGKCKKYSVGHMAFNLKRPGEGS